MGALKRVLQLDWRTLPVKEKTPGGAKRSIRRATAKALTVKVGTGRGKSRVMGGNIDLSRGVYGRVFVNYAKKNAGPARMSHFLERGHRVRDGWAAGYFPTARRFRTSSGRFRNMYMRARMVDSLSESAALDLPADEFRDLFAACSRAIVGDDCPD